jgi:type IV pilus assembly protein PilZ
MFIETATPPPYGAAVTIQIRLPQVGLTTLRGTVRWTTSEGMGVQFGPTGARDTHGLVELVR